MLGIKVAVARAGGAHLHALWKNSLENIARATGVKIRCHHDYAVPFSLFCEFRKGLRVFQRAVRVVCKPHDLIPRHSALDHTVFHQLRDPRIGPPPSPTPPTHPPLPSSDYSPSPPSPL